MTKKKSSKKRNRVNSGNSNYNDNIPKTAKNVITDCDNKNGIKGLHNLGNTCYFNSMLQMILQSPSFMVKLKAYCSSDYELFVKMGDKDVKLVLKSSEVSCVEKELIKLWETDCSSTSPAGLRSALLKNDQFKIHFSGFNEQDSHEAFLMMLNIIKEAQIKRIKKAILDLYDCKVSIEKLTDDDKLEIKTLGNITEKLTLLHSHFGIVVGSGLRCEDCGEIRFRFDESLHISPIFPNKSETNDDSGPAKQAGDDNNKVTVAADKTDNSHKKLSKHQLKKQKRIERKVNRNKKSMLRNSECSAGDEVLEIRDGDIAIETVDDSMIESESTILNDEAVSSQENIIVNPIMARFLGSTDENNIPQEPILNEFPCYDADNKNMSSSDCSRAAVGSNSSRSSLDEQSISQGDLEMLIDREITSKFTTSVSIENDVNENGVKEVSLVENSCLNNNEPIIDDYQPVTNGIDNGSDQFILNEQNNCSEFPPVLEPKNMQPILNATLESHQDYLTTLNISRILFETETDLDRAFNKFIAPLCIENLACDSCSKSKLGMKTDHIKREIICHLPFILPIYISRFKQINAKNRNIKNNQLYSYPFLLNLSPQCSKYANVGSELSPVIYRLYGIIEHIGAKINSGHYVSYISCPRDTASAESSVPPHSYSSNILNDICKKFDQNGYSDHQEFREESELLSEFEKLSASNFDWYRISDSQVEPVSNSAVLKCQAFMLFYTRVK